MSDAAKVKLGCVTSVSRTAKFQQLLYRLKTVLTDDFIRADKKKIVYKLQRSEELSGLQVYNIS